MRISYLEDDFLAVETGNNREVESALRDLPSARWIASENRWEVHLSHLPDLIGLFRIKPDRIPEQLMERFQRDWLSTDVRIEIDHSYSRILGAGVPTREIDALSSFDIAERTEDSAYLEGEWDGRRHLYDRRTFQIPTGLIDLVLELLKTKKLRVQVVDKRGQLRVARQRQRRHQAPRQRQRHADGTLPCPARPGSRPPALLPALHRASRGCASGPRRYLACSQESPSMRRCSAVHAGARCMPHRVMFDLSQMIGREGSSRCDAGKP